MRREALVLSAILVLAAALRLARVDATDLWLDEACSVHYATLDWGDLWSAFDDEIHPPLYYLALRAWGVAFGWSPVAARALSLLAGLLAVAATWRLARRLLGPVGAGVAALVLAVTPLGIYYGVEARPYALATLVVTLAVDRWLAWLQHRRRRDAVAYALLLAVAPYLHYFSLFVVPLVPLALWVRRGSRRPADAALAVLPLVAFVPWLLRFGLAHAAADSKAWIGAWWLRYGAAGSAWRSLAALGGVAEYPPYLGVLALATRGAPLALAGTLVFGAAMLVGLASRVGSPEREGGALLAWLVAPTLVPIAVSAAGNPVFVPGRYEVLALPAVAVALGACATWGPARARWLGAALVVAWLGPCAHAVTAYLGTDVERPVRLTHGLLQRQGAGVAEVLGVGFAFAPLQAAEMAEPTGVPLRPVPGTLARHPGWEHKARAIDDTDLPPPLGRPGEVWLVSQAGDGFERFTLAEGARLAAAGLTLTRSITIGDLRLDAYTPPPGNPLPTRGP